MVVTPRLSLNNKNKNICNLDEKFNINGGKIKIVIQIIVLDLLYCATILFKFDIGIFVFE